MALGAGHASVLDADSEHVFLLFLIKVQDWVLRAHWAHITGSTDLTEKLLAFGDFVIAFGAEEWQQAGCTHFVFDALLRGDEFPTGLSATHLCLWKAGITDFIVDLFKAHDVDKTQFANHVNAISAVLGFWQLRRLSEGLAVLSL